MPVYQSALEMIGNTPILQLHSFAIGECELFLKLENQNPGGSIKDRIALQMIAQAEQQGRLQPGATIIEATAGNTGIGLALIAALKGYKLILVIPDKMSREKVQHLRALGAQIHLTSSAVAVGHPQHYQSYAQRLAQQIPQSFYIDQFNNPANPQAHYLTTAPELWQQLDQRLDAVVLGVGSGGTMGGMQQYFSQHNTNVEIILADPVGSVLADYVETKSHGSAGRWLVEGIGEDFIPQMSRLEEAKQAYRISDAEAFATCQQLLSQEGILVGSSTGVLLTAAIKYCQQQTSAKRVATFACDTGNKYLSKIYDQQWLIEQGITKPTQQPAQDLSRYISRPQADGTAVVAAANEDLATIWQRMRLYDISQLPVLQDNQVVGILDEEMLLYYIAGDSRRFNNLVADVMQPVRPLAVTASIAELMLLLRQTKVALIVDCNQQFLGIITASDMLAQWKQN